MFAVRRSTRSTRPALADLHFQASVAPQRRGGPRCASSASPMAVALPLFVGLSLAVPAESASAAKAPPHIAVAWSAAYSDHPLVREVQQQGALGLLARERAFDERMPLDRALAIVDAVGVAGIKRTELVDQLVRALRARHALGPSGAMLGKRMPSADLSAREALLLGWARALSAGADAKALRVRSATIEGAGALELLELAASKAADKQAPLLALALVQATVAGGKGKPACAAFTAVQQRARDGRNESVRAAVAEAAIAQMAAQGAACPPAERQAFRGLPSLPPPAAEPGFMPNGQAARSGTKGASTMRETVAFTLRAPFFKGYLQDATVQALARGSRLDEILLHESFKRDATGDLAIAALNASLLMRRLSDESNLEVAWLTIGRRHGLIDQDEKARATLKIADLTPPEAMALAYALALDVQGGERAPQSADGKVDANQLAYGAAPADLFSWARSRLPGNALLGPILAHGHEVDRERARDACAASKRAEALGFIIQKGALPAAAKEVLGQATRTVQAGCGAGAAATPRPAAPSAGGRP